MMLIGSKSGKNGSKTQILEKIFQGTVWFSVQKMLCFPVSTSFHILTITCSFLIRIEQFKLLVKKDFKENHIYRNSHRQILIISGLKIHSK